MKLPPFEYVFVNLADDARDQTIKDQKPPCVAWSTTDAIWYVAQSPGDPEIDNMVWRRAESTEGVVRVPLFPYNVRGTDERLVVGSALQVGLCIGLQLVSRVDQPIRKMLMAIGDRFDDEESSQFWVGFAYLT